MQIIIIYICNVSETNLHKGTNHKSSHPGDVEICLNKIHNSGIQLFIGDFDTGYSSLARLKNILFSKALIEFSLALNLTVIAEGVECEVIEQWLINHNCHLMQGYLCAKPMPVSDI